MACHSASRLSRGLALRSRVGAGGCKPYAAWVGQFRSTQAAERQRSVLLRSTETIGTDHIRLIRGRHSSRFAWVGLRTRMFRHTSACFSCTCQAAGCSSGGGRKVAGPYGARQGQTDLRLYHNNDAVVCCACLMSIVDHDPGNVAGGKGRTRRRVEGGFEARLNDHVKDLE